MCAGTTADVPGFALETTREPGRTFFVTDPGAKSAGAPDAGFVEHPGDARIITAWYKARGWPASPKASRGRTAPSTPGHNPDASTLLISLTSDDGEGMAA
jgi:hypothetical protein